MITGLSHTTVLKVMHCIGLRQFKSQFYYVVIHYTQHTRTMTHWYYRMCAV